MGIESTNIKFSIVHFNTVNVLWFNSFICIKIYEKIKLRIQIWRGKQSLSNCCFTCTLKWAVLFTNSFIFAKEIEAFLPCWIWTMLVCIVLFNSPPNTHTVSHEFSFKVDNVCVLDWKPKFVNLSFYFCLFFLLPNYFLLVNFINFVLNTRLYVRADIFIILCCI